MCLQLCDALLLRDDESEHTDNNQMPAPVSQNLNHSESILEYMERANLFLVPLDDKGTWYRYHPLFVDLLRARLQRTLPARDISMLHSRAAQWYAGNGFAYDAIHHASLIPDNTLVDRLIEDNFMDILMKLISSAS